MAKCVFVNNSHKIEDSIKNLLPMKVMGERSKSLGSSKEDFSSEAAKVDLWVGESIKPELKVENGFGMETEAEELVSCTLKDDPSEVDILESAIESSKNYKNQLFESHEKRNYTTNFEKDHIKDLKFLFKENSLNFERQKFYQQMFNDIFDRTSKKAMHELRQLYLEHLHQISDLEIFRCSICDYQTINKANLKSHLWIIHKSELELKVFQCLSCTYKTKSLPLLKNHLAHHKEDSSSDNYIDRSNSPEDLKKEVKKSKVRKKTRITNQCDLCDFKSENKKKLKTHKESHFVITDNVKKFICYICKYESRDKGTIQKHLLKQHNIKTINIENKILKCKGCDYTTFCNVSFSCHILQHKQPDEIEWFKCTLCSFKTKHKRNLPLHLKSHNPEKEKVEKKYMCEVCSKTFLSRSNLKRHLLTHKTIDEVSEIFQCHQCSFKTKKKSNLKQHMEVHSDLKKFVCDICGYQSNRKGNYELHVLAHKDENEVELHSCNVCGYKTKNKYRLNKHLKRGHSGSSQGKGRWKPTDYSCYVCNIDLKDRKTYSDHLKTHENPEDIAKKRLACEFCEYRTKHKAFLDLHLLSHKHADQVQSFKCPQQGCDFQSKFKTSLNAHVLRHKDPTEVTMYKCDTCGHQSRLKWSHKLHLMTHKSVNEVEIFSCDICSYHTKFKAYLKQHLKKRHGIVTTRIRVKN